MDVIYELMKKNSMKVLLYFYLEKINYFLVLSLIILNNRLFKL